MKTSDVMTRNVLTVARETSVANAIRVMLDHSVSGLPVLENGKVVGIVTEGTSCAAARRVPKGIGPAGSQY
jgi:CBS domain-containing protein